MKALFDQARKALDFLERHHLDPSVAHYEFALRYVTDPTSKLALEVNEQTYGGLRLTSDAMLKLVERYSLRNLSTALDDRERTVARQAEELGTLTSDAHDLTEALGRDVGTMVEQAEDWPKSTGDLVARLSDAERDLAELRNEFLTLRNEVGSSVQRRANADRDELTQALNQSGARTLFDRFAEHGRTYVMIMFSIDNLIGVNERFGRGVGDNVLNAFAATLRQVFLDEELIRWTGNEFIIVATNLATAAARLLVEDALAALRARQLKLRGTGEWIGTVTASAGIVASHGDSPEAVLAHARANALSAAAHGGNRSEG
jgi:diguanylate cyclase